MVWWLCVLIGLSGSVAWAADTGDTGVGGEDTGSLYDTADESDTDAGGSDTEVHVPGESAAELAGESGGCGLAGDGSGGTAAFLFVVGVFGAGRRRVAFRGR